ncbi:acyltransferase family protein [Terrisporobacter hibernicus]|uniref:Acyltransferase family protein n=1 Tax=Terrisporobacter hibernicus TaxID=2813371 RepID=A0AAX2ZF65_9FIRM|nr:acyltransferase family protein [Terrisporobacter hibernicus]UEL47365.1 acyltransferase family protein [Terrisporobacter hibernicus]
MNKRVIEEYNLTRVFAVILVVIGHCTYYTINTNYGGIDYISIMENMNVNDTITHKLLEIMVRIIYSFHMPLFVALSGALFSIQMKGNRYQRLNLLVKDKFFRLIVPFFVITLCYVVPLKFISQYFNDNLIELVKEIILGQFMLMGNSSLWFLPSLFLNFIMLYIIEKKYNGKDIFKIVLFITMYLISYKITIPIISNPLRYILWFYMGYKFESVRVKFNIYINQNKIIFIISLGMFIFTSFIGRKILDTNILYLSMKIICNWATTILGCFIVYYVSYLLITNTKIMDYKLTNIIKDNSFGIYLYSDTLNYLILFLIYNIYGIGVFGSEFGALIIFLIRLILTTIISIAISKLLKRKNLKYIC